MMVIGILIFPGVEELDFVGPFEVLSYVNKCKPGAQQVLLVSQSLEPVRAFNGLRVLPDMLCADCPTLDILVVPGGKGRLAAMHDPAIREFVQNQARTARFVTSVCTGAFILAEAGLLRGKQATTYHTNFAELSAYGVEVIAAKVVRDGNIITAGGVSSGLELGFYLIRELFGVNLAQEVARCIEYQTEVAAL